MKAHAGKLFLPLLVLCLALLLGSRCGGSTGTGPAVAVTLHAVEDDLKSLLVVPSQSALAIHASFAAGDSPVDPETLGLYLGRWGGASYETHATLVLDETSAVVLVDPDTLDPGTYTVTVWVADTAGRVGVAELSFAVRTRAAAAPIGVGQKIWFDFTSDRDSDPGPDFPVDLQVFGLGSPAQPLLSAQVEARVIEALLSRVSQAYHEVDGLGLGVPDPVQVDFYADDPGPGDVTRICVGGNDPSGQKQIGSILIDANNAQRSSVECGTIPPTGIFSRELTLYQNQAAFQNTFDPLMPSRGGTPAGEHPLDPIVLHPDFDPAAATPEELARYDAIQTAVSRFGNALGSVMAHETGHALGLVAPGKPGPGLHGGTSGATFAHDVTSDGVTSPTPNYLMKHGGTFNFARLAGIAGQPLPFMRALDFAYLRDRVMTDPRITELLPPPTLSGVTPSTITATTQIAVTGTGFAATPALFLVNPGYTYAVAGEAFVSSTQMTGWISYSQCPPGLYDLLIENKDGQLAVLPAAISVGGS